MKMQYKADLMLVIVTLGWGISYYLMDVAMTDMGPFTLNAYRFLGAFFVAGILAFNKLKTVNKATLKASLLLGTIVLFVYSLTTFGVRYTTLSNSGFLCALTVIFVPIIERVFFRKKQNAKVTVAVIISLIGIMLLTLKSDFSINMDNLLGDALCMLCAVVYALDLIFTEKEVTKEEVNAFQLGIFQLGVTGTYMLILSMIFEEPHIPSNPSVIASVAFLSIFCTGIAFIVQAIAQQYTTAAHVGIIFTLEPVFAGVVAYFLAGEVLTPKAYFGAVLMLAALLVTEIDFKPKKKNVKKITDC